MGVKLSGEEVRGTSACTDAIDRKGEMVEGCMRGKRLVGAGRRCGKSG